MFELYRKSKTAIILTILPLALALAVLVGGGALTRSRRDRFAQEGYTLEVAMQEDQMAVIRTTRFSSGTALTRKAAGEVAFQNVEGQNVRTDAGSFVHYEDGALTSVNGMALTDLARFPEGVMDTYYIDGLLALQSADGVYTIQNNTSELSFEDFVLKTEDKKYLLASPALTLTRLNGKTETIDTGFVELNYLDDDNLYASVTDGENAWQFRTEGGTITFGNGAVLGLEDLQLANGSEGAAVYSLKDQEVSPEASIEISVQDDAEGWIAPTFIVNPVDGADGKSGADGASGADGEDGEDGESGADGDSGGEGSGGENGSGGGTGNEGERGVDGQNTDEEDSETEILYEPHVSITSWDQTAGSVEFSLAAYNTTLIKDGTLEVYLMDAGSGEIKKLWGDDVLSGLMGDEDEPQGEVTGLSCDSLTPGGVYKLVVQAMVKKSTDDTNDYAKKVLLSRRFTLDATGFFLKKVQSAYLREEDGSLESFGDLYPGSQAAEGAMLALQAVVPSTQQIKSISSVEITYRDKNTGISTEWDGNPFVDAEGEGDPVNVEEECERLAQGEIYPLFGLESNTEYTFTINAEVKNEVSPKAEETTFTVTYKTLKATPYVWGAGFEVSAGRFFISSVSASDFSDPDLAIESYRHDIYRYPTASDTEPDSDRLKSKVSAQGSAYIYLNGSTICSGTDSSGRLYYYGNRIFYTWYDNEKYQTREVERLSSWKPQCIEDTDVSYVQFSETEIGNTSIEGKLTFSTGAGNTVYVGNNDVHRLLVQITASGYTKVLYYSDLKKWWNSSGAPISATAFQGKATTDLELTDLLQDTNYTITVTGYFEEHGGSSRTIGSTVVKTE